MPRAASSFYTAQQQRILSALTASRAEWSKLSKPADFDRIYSRLLAIIMAGQLGAATDGASMVAPSLLEQKSRPAEQLAGVSPAGFVGWATSMRDPGISYPLESLVQMTPGIAQGAGVKVADQMAAGQHFLDLVVHTQIQDAGRMAAGAGIAVRRGTGWVRHVNPPCCRDCAVQAGKLFRWNSGFDRHPNCDCVHVPAFMDSQPGALSTQPPLDQITNLTIADRRAIVDGADLSQVVNSHRYRQNAMFTAEGTSKRGYAAYMQRAIDREHGLKTVTTVTRSLTGKARNVTRTKARLTPEGIYKIAGDDREKAVLMLIQNGYVVGDIAKLARSAAVEMQRMAAALN